MIAFAVIAVLTLASAAVAMSLRNMIHSALLLIASWAGIAAFYLWAGAEFVAFAQVLVYVGGAVLGVLFGAVVSTPFEPSSDRASSVTVRELGTQLMGPHAAALLVVGVLLTVALLGAVVIAATDRPANREEKL